MWQLLSAAVVVAAIAIALLLAWGSARNGHDLGLGWAGLLSTVFGTVLGAVLGLPEVVKRLQEKRPGAAADAVPSAAGGTDDGA